MASWEHLTGPGLLTLRDPTDPSPTDKFLGLIQNPFKSQFQITAVWASLGTSIGITFLLALLFSLFRPRHNVIYAPKLKHADQKHSPPPVGKGLFAWLHPVLHTKEEDVADRIGMDATIFLRFTYMCRDIFLALTIIGCAVLIPVNLSQSQGAVTKGFSVFSTMTPMYVSTDAIWAQVICAWALNLVVVFFLWRNYRAVLALRRRHFHSHEYQNSLHARTLMITDIPQTYRTDEALLRLTEEVNPTSALPRATIARNVKDLPELIKKHDESVRELESVLSKYLKRPDRLPSKRPTLRPPREKGADRPGKVDAIDYWTDRIRELEMKIKDVRQSVDKRGAMPFGFASWELIEHAHAVAYYSRRKHPHGTTFALAPKPSDLIWENLRLTPQMRRWKRIVNIFWVTVLTLVWIVPNALIAVFLADLNNLGVVWPAFQTSLTKDPHFWAAVQGIASPALTSLTYFVLPTIFRRLAVRGGNITKTSREGHVIHHLYAFFIFNNLIVFSLFSAAWTFVAAVVKARNNNSSLTTVQVIEQGQFYTTMMNALCQVSPFWVSWLLQRNLGAAIDLVQVVNLSWVWFTKTFMSPTPRQTIEWTAPQPFDYASYYNYFLFYATVALCFSTLQPVVLPVMAFFFAVDASLKKYLLMYVFVTKNESGGRFWRLIFNRMVFATIIATVVIGLVVKAKGSWTMVFCVLPLPFLLLAFKIYCMKTFDHGCDYYNRANLSDAEALAINKPMQKSTHRLGSKFGPPALHRPLPTPMVHAKAIDALKQIYRGRLGGEDVSEERSGIAMESMSSSRPGRSAEAAPFEVVAENQLDFSYFKNRPDFRDEFGGGIYGRPEDLISERSHTPRSFMMGGGDSPSSSRPSSPALSHSEQKLNEGDLGTGMPMRRPSDSSHPAFRRQLSDGDIGINAPALYRQSNESETRLLSNSETNISEHSDRWRAEGYSQVSRRDPSATSYDYFRGRR
ncbi:hypothetical protein Egran_02926 [Elaphomyces granulatus]|uniref:CSC1/OSCA1-like 7TM region domain-containing protein n=1 Tax=Elaphomyces granulatus TaxID=519963 RepID=A0A232LYW5_9EURO|nr:hypothetical protein Egran_02926 [Elaphomyces granulatus]